MSADSNFQEYVNQELKGVYPVPEQMTMEAIRAQIEEAIYAKIALDQANPDYDPEVEGTPFVLGWAVTFEFTSDQMEQRDTTAGGIVVASQSQSRATTRGLFELGSDKFTV